MRSSRASRVDRENQKIRSGRRTNLIFSLFVIIAISQRLNNASNSSNLGVFQVDRRSRRPSQRVNHHGAGTEEDEKKTVAMCAPVDGRHGPPSYASLLQQHANYRWFVSSYVITQAGE